MGIGPKKRKPMQKSFNATLNELHKMLGWVGERLVNTSFSDIEKRRIQIALEEGLVNIISYAYQGEIGKISLLVEIVNQQFLEITIEDFGVAFNPLKHKKEVNPHAPIEDLEIGGLGIVFIEKIMDHVKYERFEKKNRLILRKNLP